MAQAVIVRGWLVTKAAEAATSVAMTAASARNFIVNAPLAPGIYPRLPHHPDDGFRRNRESRQATMRLCVGDAAAGSILRPAYTARPIGRELHGGQKREAAELLSGEATEFPLVATRHDLAFVHLRQLGDGCALMSPRLRLFMHRVVTNANESSTTKVKRVGERKAVACALPSSCRPQMPRDLASKGSMTCNFR